MQQEAPHYIVVEGPIGVGKTTLARKLAESFDSELLLEGADENPFLERFYRNRRLSALPTQLFFLFQRARQIESLQQADLFQPVRVSDFLMQKDRLFAEITLDEQEFHIYEQVYAHAVSALPVPDLVIYLQAPVDVLLRRIARRGINYEQKIDARYLRQLCDAYARFFHNYEASPLLIVNAAGIDLVNHDEDFVALLDEVRGAKPGRQYFNRMTRAI